MGSPLDEALSKTWEVDGSFDYEWNSKQGENGMGKFVQKKEVPQNLVELAEKYGITTKGHTIAWVKLMIAEAQAKESKKHHTVYTTSNAPTVDKITADMIAKLIAMGQKAQGAVDHEIIKALLPKAYQIDDQIDEKPLKKIISAKPVELPKKSRTVREQYDECMACTTMEAMRTWFTRERQWMVKTYGMDGAKAERILKENLGYTAGYDGVDALEYLYNWLGIVHPVFGAPDDMRKLSAEDIIKLGMEAATNGILRRYGQETGFTGKYQTYVVNKAGEMELKTWKCRSSMHGEVINPGELTHCYACKAKRQG